MQNDRMYSQAQFSYLMAKANRDSAWADWQAAPDDDRVIDAYTVATHALRESEQALIDWSYGFLETNPKTRKMFARNREILERARTTPIRSKREGVIALAMKLDPETEGKPFDEWRRLFGV